MNAKVLEDTVKREIADGKIVIFSSHQMNYVEEFCDNIAILNDGKIALSGSIHDIKRSYKRDKLVIRTEDHAPILSAYGSSVSKREDGSLLLKMDSADDKQRVMQELTTKYDIDEVRVYEPTMNDIFVEYTTGGSDAETAEGGEE